MKELVLKAKNADSFDNQVLKSLIACIPGAQKLSVDELRKGAANKEIRIPLTDAAFNGTALRILNSLGEKFSIGL